MVWEWFGGGWGWFGVVGGGLGLVWGSGGGAMGRLNPGNNPGRVTKPLASAVCSPLHRQALVPHTNWTQASTDDRNNRGLIRYGGEPSPTPSNALGGG